MSWLIRFQKTARSPEKLIELLSEEKLLYWLAHTGCKCVRVYILKKQNAEE